MGLIHSNLHNLSDTKSSHLQLSSKSQGGMPGGRSLGCKTCKSRKIKVIDLYQAMRELVANSWHSVMRCGQFAGNVLRRVESALDLSLHLCMTKRW